MNASDGILKENPVSVVYTRNKRVVVRNSTPHDFSVLKKRRGFEEWSCVLFFDKKSDLEQSFEYNFIDEYKFVVSDRYYGSWSYNVQLRISNPSGPEKYTLKIDGIKSEDFIDVSRCNTVLTLHEIADVENSTRFVVIQTTEKRRILTLSNLSATRDVEIDIDKTYQSGYECSKDKVNLIIPKTRMYKGERQALKSDIRLIDNGTRVRFYHILRIEESKVRVPIKKYYIRGKWFDTDESGYVDFSTIFTDDPNSSDVDMFFTKTRINGKDVYFLQI